MHIPKAGTDKAPWTFCWDLGFSVSWGALYYPVCSTRIITETWLPRSEKKTNNKIDKTFSIPVSFATNLHIDLRILRAENTVFPRFRHHCAPPPPFRSPCCVLSLTPVNSRVHITFWELLKPLLHLLPALLSPRERWIIPVFEHGRFPLDDIMGAQWVPLVEGDREGEEAQRREEGWGAQPESGCLPPDCTFVSWGVHHQSLTKDGRMPLPWDAGCTQPSGRLSYFTLPGEWLQRPFDQP